MSTNIPRRTFAKGTAWAAPVLIASTVAPAYAASQCMPSISFSGGLAYYWGTIPSSRTNQNLNVGGQTYVNNLPPGVTVTNISYQFWIQNRNGQTSAGPGVFYVKNASSDRSGQNAAAMPWTPTAGSGFANTVSSTSNLTPHTYSNGTTLDSWDLNMQWTASKDTLRQYTNTTTGCRNFTTGPSARFNINYSNVAGLSSTNDSRKHIYSDVTIKVTLSNGQTLQMVTNTVTGS